MTAECADAVCAGWDGGMAATGLPPGAAGGDEAFREAKNEQPGLFTVPRTSWRG